MYRFRYFTLFVLILFSPLATTIAEDPPYPKIFEEELKRAEVEGGSKFSQEFSGMLVTLSGIIAAIVVLMWILKRMIKVKIEKENLSSGIRILERRILSPKTALYVVDFSGKTFAIAESTNGITLIGDLPKQTPSNPSNQE